MSAKTVFKSQLWMVLFSSFIAHVKPVEEFSRNSDNFPDVIDCQNSHSYHRVPDNFPPPFRMMQTNEKERKIKTAVRFYLFTQKNLLFPQDITDREVLKNSSCWNKNEKVKIIVHGFWQRGMARDPGVEMYTGSSELIKDGYMSMNRTENVVIIDWSRLSNAVYCFSVHNMPTVATEIADLLIFLVESKMTKSYSDIHFVGFSLGAHLAGIVGNILITVKQSKIGRITGLDPAGPGFGEKTDKTWRLDKSDAEFVDVIHCNTGEYGTTLESGHVDFYPNGGRAQPDCFWDVLGLLFCNHLRCPKLFEETIRGQEYIGCSCTEQQYFNTDDCNCKNGPVMGEFCPKNATGNFYLRTRTQLTSKIMDATPRYAKHIMNNAFFPN